MNDALVVSHLTKTYASGVQAIKGIDFSIQEGDFYALLGANGAGKSTTMGIISSLVNKSTGSVSIFGHDIDHSPSEAKKLLGMVPQEINLSIFETSFDILVQQAGYFGIAPKVAQTNAEKYLNLLDLWDKRKARAMDLSGGMRRRLMIARAMVHEPKLLILDEPTAGVDVSIRQSMWKLLKRLNKEGTTIILSTHYLEEAEHLCRNIGILNRGELVENTSMKKLLAKASHQTYVINVVSPIDDLPSIRGFDLTLLDSTTIRAEFEATLDLNVLLRGLMRAKLHIQNISPEFNRLEQLFITLTGETK